MTAPRARRSTAAAVAALFLLTSLSPHGLLSTADAAAPRATVGPFTFEVGPYNLQVLPTEWVYDSTIVSSCGLTDSNGVAMYRSSSGVIHDHPVAQAQCASNMVRNYRLTSDPAHLQQAIANAQRLLDRAVPFGGGIFFPYPFEWVNSGRGTMRPPWYSAMAQGIGLTAFVRLHEWTGDAKWAQAAAQTFASYKVTRSAGGPWVVGVETGRLWLDEYPTVPLDRVFNGHNFSLYGLYDYWRTTANPEARLLLLGALHSSYLAVSTLVRVPGGISRYCVSAACMALNVKNVNYHPLHTRQLRQLSNFTGHWHFASMAEAFTADSPDNKPGTVLLAAGAHDGYAFDAAGVGTKTLTVSLPGPVEATYSARAVPGAVHSPGKNGVWLRVSSGALAGRWVKESDRARAKGYVDRLSFYPGRSVKVSAGTFAASRHADDGALLESTSLVTGAATWTYSDVARVNGYPSILLKSGPLAGWWVRLDHRTLRDATLYTDVDASIFRSDIIWLTDQGITRGCAQYQFCPSGAVTREQMASFLVRALRLPSTAADFFTDDDASPHEGDINRLAAAGITAGCGPGRYCPSRSLSRAEMASLMVRAFGLPPTSGDFFTDDDTSPHEGDINRLAAAGITAGCAEGRFCPASTITRGQMAAFLRRALASGAPSASQASGPAPATPAPSPASSPTPAPIATPTAVPTAEPTALPEPSELPTPSVSPTSEASPTPSAEPSAPSAEPTDEPDPGG